MKKLIALALALFTVISLIACGKTDSTGTSGSEQVAQRTVDGDGLPKLDFDGATVVITGRTEMLTYMTRDTLTNDVLNDAIYNMNKSVEARLNVKLKYYAKDATSKDSNDSAGDVVIQSVLAGLDEYQIYTGRGTFSTREAISVKGGTFLNILSDRVKYVDIDKPWWNSYMAENTEVYGILPIITGDLSVAYTREMMVTYFNKNILEENGIDVNMYSLVTSGGWTYEKQLSLIKGTYADVTGDGKTDDDRYGLVMFDDLPIDAYWSAFDLSLVNRTDDGGIELSTDNSKLADALELLYTLCFENKDVNAVSHVNSESYKSGDNDGPEVLEAFADDRALFITSSVKSTDNAILRNMTNDYGIIPMPKWDENQTEYYTYITDSYNVYAIPKTVVNADAASAVLEALAIEAYKYVQPAYYDKVLRGRYTRDLESREMLEYITSHVKLDATWIHSYALDKLPQYAIRYQLNERHSKSFASFWRANRSKYNKSLETFLEAFEDYNG